MKANSCFVLMRMHTMLFCRSDISTTSDGLILHALWHVNWKDILYKHILSVRRNIPDWKISTKAAAAAEEEECSEFTSVPSRTSSGMVEAISIKPDSPELDVNFDGHDFGFFGDVGAKHFYRPTSMYLLHNSMKTLYCLLDLLLAASRRCHYKHYISTNPSNRPSDAAILNSYCPTLSNSSSTASHRFCYPSTAIHSSLLHAGNFEEPSMNAISEENIMPWDM